jgi:hypothetical protein
MRTGILLAIIGVWLVLRTVRGNLVDKLLGT